MSWRVNYHVLDISGIGSWDLPTGKMCQTISAHQAPFAGDGGTSVAISPGDQTLVSDSYDQTVRIWY